MKKETKTTTKKTAAKPGKQEVNPNYRWESGAGVRPISELKPIKRGK